MTVYMSRGDAKMDIEFRVFDDGFGFRYIFPEQTTKQFTVTDEKTQMAMTGDHTAWWIPATTIRRNMNTPVHALVRYATMPTMISCLTCHHSVFAHRRANCIDAQD